MENPPQAENIISKVPRVVWLSLAVTVAMDTAVQMVWKSAVLAVPESAGFMETIRTVGAAPMFYLLLTFFAAQFLCWILLLAKADLSYAQPITALSFVSVAACSAVFFGEHVGLTRMAGISMILVGVWFISGTDHHTKAGPATCRMQETTL